jgi:hypothetical protein
MYPSLLVRCRLALASAGLAASGRGSNQSTALSNIRPDSHNSSEISSVLMNYSS